MEEVFVRKYWDEDDTLFYLHFQDGEAVRQIEITPKGVLFLTLERPQYRGSMLFDQSLEQLDLQPRDFITEEEFEMIWNKKGKT